MKTARFIFIFISYTFCISVNDLVAQVGYNKDSLISSKIADLNSFWKKYNDLTTNKNTFEEFSIIPAIYEVKAGDTVSRIDYLNKVNEAKINLLKKDIGLDLVANYVENFDPAPSEDNLVYKRRVAAGLDWNIFSDGYLNSRYKQKILENESIINSLKPQTKFDGNNVITISHKIIYSFNTQKIKLLEQRQEIINDKITIANELYLLKHLPRIDLLDIMQQQVDVNSMNLVYKSYNDELKLRLNETGIPKNTLPLFDVAIEQAFFFSKEPVSDSILKLKIENLVLEHKPLNDIKLNTQFRYNYYDLSNPALASRNYLSAGIGLSVPIPLGIKANKNVVEAQSKLLTYEQKESQGTEQTDLLNYFYEFRYKLKQYINFYEKRKKYEELIRVERVKEKFGDFEFNPLSALNLIDEMLTVDIEMLDIEQQMYLQLLDINVKLPGVPVSTLIKPFKVDTTSLPPEKISRSMYVWSESQSLHDASYIEEYLRLNKVSTAIVSIKKDQSNKMQAIELIGKLASFQIRSEILIGSNKLLTDKNPEMYFDSILSGLDLKNVSAMHLDVEPHTQADWDVNKDKLLTQYIDLLKKARNYCTVKGIRLSVSIPVFYPENSLTDIYALADNVYLMAYEHSDAAFIVKKVKEELLISPNKTIIALRAKDFKNRTEFESLVSELSQALSTTQFAMHDFETFVKLDELSVH